MELNILLNSIYKILKNCLLVNKYINELGYCRINSEGMLLLIKTKFINLSQLYISTIYSFIQVRTVSGMLPMRRYYMLIGQMYIR
jgi:hypothetical protein